MRRALLLLALGWPVLSAAGVSDRVDTLERRMEAVSELLLDVEQLKRENAELRGQIEVLKHELEQVKTQQRELYLDMDRRLSGGGAEAPSSGEAASSTPPQTETPAASPEPPAEPPKGSTTSSESDEAQAYKAAYELLIPQRKYPEAVSAFTAFLQRYPSGDYADNAQFWLGEAHYANRDYDASLNAFQRLSEVFPQSPKVPDALLKVGYIRYAQGEYDKARHVFEGLIEHYPDTSASRLAKQRLEAMAAAGH